MVTTTSKSGKGNGARAAAAKATSSSTSSGRSVSDMEAQIEALKAEIAALTGRIAESGERSYEQLRKAATEGADQLLSQGEAAMRGLKDNARDIEEQVSEAVREKPMTALAVAAGVGFLFALMARR